MRRTWGRAECGSWSDGSRICRRRSRRLKWIRIHTQSPQKTCSPLDASCSCYQYRLHRIYSRYIHRRQDGVQLNAPLSDDTKQGSFISWETKLPYESENKADEWTLQLPFFRRWFALFNPDKPRPWSIVHRKNIWVMPVPSFGDISYNGMLWPRN